MPRKAFTPQTAGRTDQPQSNVATPVSNVIAVIDCGATAIRVTIAEEFKNDWRVLEEINRRIDLLPALEKGRFDRHTLDEVVNAFAAVLEYSSLPAA